MHELPLGTDSVTPFRYQPFRYGKHQWNDFLVVNVLLVSPMFYINMYLSLRSFSCVSVGSLDERRLLCKESGHIHCLAFGRVSLQKALSKHSEPRPSPHTFHARIMPPCYQQWTSSC